MKTVLVKALLVIAITLPFSAFAQECLDFHKTNCKSMQQTKEDGTIDTDGYVYSEDSRSALMVKGQTSEFKFMIHQGKDYRLSLCASEILGRNIKFELIDFEENTVLYDNSQFEFKREFEFSVMQTRNLKIRIHVPADQEAANAVFGIKAKDTEMGCVGVLIEKMVTPKTGF